MKIGILDIQGSVREHRASLRNLGVEAVLVKELKHLENLKGLVIPGGESTTIGKLLGISKLDKAIKEKFENGMGIWGTCAGAILLAKSIVGNQQASSLQLMDITVERNAYGRQIDSFETELKFEDDSSFFDRKIPAVFIRAPKIVAVGENVEIVAKYKEEIVAAKQGNLFATTFHPELTEDLKVHEYFIELCEF